MLVPRRQGCSKAVGERGRLALAMSLRLGSTDSSAADCDARDPDEQGTNDDRCDQYCQHAERRQVDGVRELFLARRVEGGG